MHLTKEARDTLMMELECAICPSAKGYRVKYEATFGQKTVDQHVFSARRTPERNHYRMVQCHDCGLVFSTPVFREDRLKALYATSCFTYEKETENIKESYARLLHIASRFVPQKGKLLEVGGGSGFFLEAALDQGYREVHGVEPSVEAVNRASARIRGNMKTAFYEPGLYPGEFFDIICVFHVLDHVLSPNTFLKTCFDNLARRGVALFVVHDIGALSARLLGERSPIIDIEHIYLFDKNTLSAIFKKNGFTVLKVFDITNTYTLEYWTRMFTLPQALKGPMLWLLNATRLLKLRWGLQAGNIAIIAQRP